MKKATIYDYARMCNKIDDCYYCPLDCGNNATDMGCGNFVRECPDKANEIILKWCDEHPVETRQDRFLKMFPNAQKLYTGILRICPKIVDETLDINCPGRPCFGCYKEYWLAEVKENE